MTTGQHIGLRAMGFLGGAAIGLVAATMIPSIMSVATTAVFLGCAWVGASVGYVLAVVTSHRIRRQERIAQASRPIVVPPQEAPRTRAF